MNAAGRVSYTRIMTKYNLTEEELDYINGKVEEYAQRVYGGDMDAHSRGVYRDMLIKEMKFEERAQADFIRGYDDGESQTTVDQNHYNGKK